MSGSLVWQILFGAVLWFALGIRLGSWFQDRLWREKARDGFRMESAGTLYCVTEDRPEPRVVSAATGSGPGSREEA